MRSITDLMRTRGPRRLREAGAPAQHPPLARLGRSDIWQQLRTWPWLRPVLRAAWAVLVVTGLAWMGARSERSASPAAEADATTASMLAMLSTTTAAQGPLVAVAATKHGDEQRDAGHKPRDRRGVLEDGRVVLNEATDEDLRRLPGIGPARAAKIMALRDRLGRFRSFRQLLQVRGIGPRTLHKLEPRMVLNAPPNDAGQADGEPEKKR